jgi:diaminopimelate epimerase
VIQSPISNLKTQTMTFQLFKYQALGNDMLVIDPAQFDLALTPARARLLCDRHFGVGADGICYGPLPDEPGPNAMRFLNPDGSEAEKSGNGLRILPAICGMQATSTAVPTPSPSKTSPSALRCWMTTAHTIALEMGKVTFSRVEEEWRRRGKYFG